MHGPGTTVPATRYERKFLPAAYSFAEVLRLIRWHPALFREAYPTRAVNNLYFDTPGLHHYHSHVAGAAERQKVRLRWYGPFAGLAERPTLEFKCKHGEVGRKACHALPAWHIDGGFPDGLAATLRQQVEESARPGLECLRPVLANRYQRRYFRSANGACRLTVDTDLEFAAPRQGARLRPALPAQAPALIVELKYDVARAAEAQEIAVHFPFRLTRCSKYVLGVEALGQL
jgi:hypothetical protein